MKENSIDKITKKEFGGLVKEAIKSGFKDPRFKWALAIDTGGMASYLGLFMGPAAVGAEFLDVIYAPVQAHYIEKLYGNELNTKIWKRIGFLEEILPYTDIIPSATMAHFAANYNNVKEKSKKYIPVSQKSAIKGQ